MHFWVFFKVKVQNGGYFFWGGGLLKFQIFLGVLEIPFFLGGGGGGGGVNGRCWARMKKKMRVPPPPWDCRMTTTKSCRFVGGRDATVALPA